MRTTKDNYQNTASMSRQKREALKLLSATGVKISDGRDYMLDEYLVPGTTLEDVRKRLSKIKGSVSQEVVEARKK